MQSTTSIFSDIKKGFPKPAHTYTSGILKKKIGEKKTRDVEKS